MEFKLSNGRHRITDLEYLNDLRAVANRLGKNTLKQRDYSKENGAKYNVSSAINRFDGWDNTLKRAGLKGEDSLKGMKYGDKEIKEDVLLADLVRVTKELNKQNISCNDYDKFGKYTYQTMRARFGSWNEAKQRAKLKVTKKADYTEKELFKNILELWTLLGRQPKYGEVISPNSKYHGSTYARKFGSWRSALEAFVEFINNEEKVVIESNEKTNSKFIPINTSEPNKTKKVVIRKRTTRNINLRLRFTILQRDNFSCNKCGRSPATDSSVILHVDHILPWSKGGETEIENLETLCKNCNLGKSNVL